MSQADALDDERVAAANERKNAKQIKQLFERLLSGIDDLSNAQLEIIADLHEMREEMRVSKRECIAEGVGMGGGKGGKDMAMVKLQVSIK